VQRSITLAVLLILFGRLLWAQTLRAGAAESIITPEFVHGRAVYLAGFGHKRVATGVHDDLYVRCLALGIAKERIVMCSVDLIGLFYDDVLTIRRAFSQRAPGANFLIVASTHTHAGPDTLGLYGPAPLETGIDPKYLDWVDERIATTAANARHEMQPAKLELGRDDHPLLKLLQGVDRPPLVKDPFLFAMRLTAYQSGKTIATVVNWSDHPETLGRKNTEITADYPHWVRAYLEQQWGGIALFFSGSIGKVSPLGPQVSLLDPETDAVAEDGTWRKAELLGTEIGRLALRALERGEKVGVDSIVVRSSVVFVPMDNLNFRAAEAAGVFAGRKPFYTNQQLDPAKAIHETPNGERMEISTGHDIQTEVDYAELRARGKAVAQIVTVPGEIYPELVNGGIARYEGADYPDAPFEPILRERLTSKYQFIFGLGNDEIGYLIPKAEWDAEPPWLKNAKEPWYGEVNSVGPDAANAVLETLVALIQR
jgi:hypothetical protein